MFSFFTKKDFLIDHLEGFIDIHNHILPGIDDGAKTVEESIELIRGFGEFGVKDFICTPHIMHNYYDNTPKTIKKSYKKLKKALAEKGIEDVNLNYAAEHMIDDNFEHILKSGQILPSNTHYLLIEMSYLQPSINFDVSIQEIKKKNLFIVLAHPERYVYLQKKITKYLELKSQGIQFQLNLLSLFGYYGSGVQKISHKLLELQKYDYVASDLHHISHLKALKEIKINQGILKLLIPVIHNTLINFKVA